MSVHKAAHPPHLAEIATFLNATATALRDTATRLERTTSHITEYITARPGLVERHIIVALQDFDRLQQEFTAFADVLSQASAKPGETWLREEGSGHPAGDAIATVSIADLKERLVRSLDGSMFDLAPAAEEVVF